MNEKMDLYIDDLAENHGYLSPELSLILQRVA